MKISFMAAISFILLCGCVQKELSFSIPVLRDNEMQKEMSVNTGDVLNFELESNPTTGYEWVVDYDRDFLVLVHSSFIESEKKGLVGVPGKQRFRFKAIKKGETTIEFLYRRPWEKDREPAKKIVCKVKIK